MNTNPLLYLKLGLVGLVIVGCFVLVITGKLDVSSLQTTVTALVGALVVALGITAGGQHVGAAMGKAMADSAAASLPPPPATKVGG